MISLSVGILRETKRRDLVPRMAMEEEIIDTDSPNGASTCCVYVGSDDSMVSTVSLLQKKRKTKRPRDTWFTAPRDYEHVLMNIAAAYARGSDNKEIRTVLLIRECSRNTGCFQSKWFTSLFAR